MMPILTDVPSAPRMRPMVSARVLVFTGMPSMVTMMSPERIPACAAGEPSKGAITTTWSSSIEIGGIRIERCHHAANCSLQQLMVVHGIYVIMLHPFEHCCQHVRVLPGQ